MTDKELDMLDDSGLDIVNFLQILWKHKVVIIALVVASSLLMFIKTMVFTENTYTSYGVLHISNKKEETNGTAAIQKNDIETSKTLSTTYIEILKTRVFLKEVSDAVGGKYSSGQIGAMLNISTVNNTELLKISVTTGNPSESLLIAEAIMDKAPNKLMSVYKTGEVEIVDPPVYSESADGKGYTKNIAIGFVLGLLAGAVYAFIYEFLDKKVHKSEDVAKRYNISILGETAQNVKKTKKWGRNSDKPNDEIKKIINSDTDFDTVETYKSIRTNIMFSMPKQDLGRAVIVTSASPGEGKTTTVINLAITFAQTGAKVLIIDCDLRRSRIHRYLQIERNDGVTNVVCGYTELEKTIRKNVRENLDCLTAGEIPPNPAELLQTKEFQDMVSQLQKEYDYIFIDTPPITVVTDAAILTKLCAGVIVVARNEMTTYDLLDAAIGEVKNTGAKILGAIVHDCNDKYKKYGYYKSGKYGGRYKYKYKYDYRYGDDGRRSGAL